MATEVKGDLYEKVDGKLFEIKRQLRQRGGYPYDPEELAWSLQRLVEGKFFGFQWNIWKTIEIGVFKSVEELKLVLIKHGVWFRFDKSDKDHILASRDFKLSSVREKLELVKVTVGNDLGFHEDTELGKIYDRATDCGLSLCPPEVGPILALDADSFKDDELGIAMSPITTGKSPRHFVLKGTTNEKSLGSWDRGRLDAKRPPYTKLVFCRRKH